MPERAYYDGPIIDAHHHFWDPVANFHPWLSNAENIPFRYGDYSAIKRKYFPEDYFADTAPHNVVATVYVETEWDANDPLGETRFISSVAREYGAPNAVVAQAWLHHDDAQEILAGQAANSLVRSIRHKPGGASRPEDAHNTPSLMDNAQWRKGFAYLHAYGLHFDLQTPWWHLDAAARLAHDFPDTQIILNHAGLPSDRSAAAIDAWRNAMRGAAACPNICVKISGIGQKDIPWTVESNGNIIRTCIELFGSSRVMFASNFPVDSLCASFDTIFNGFKQIASEYSPQEQRAMFHDNAKRIYQTKTRESLHKLSIDGANIQSGSNA